MCVCVWCVCVCVCGVCVVCVCVYGVCMCVCGVCVCEGVGRGRGLAILTERRLTIVCATAISQ